ncbi:hypothetical protein HZI73_18130 [Vallitalea pronyensis]|uniref:Uncharacterized protein n=1 Tax=Vallitalea pronyensis TaxID=1348613 RepID=A0A8J8MMQ3_9FIRM|nr:hypothetical protein [Vallitalea pronyensis]QUI24093.1 hypothetical protein HZI73_18130 [Vallitalea pronyensis]
MSKNYRGKSINRKTKWRGTCPKCNRTGVKLIWPQGNIKVCKQCFSKNSSEKN